jgi:PAS domain S-box-containing protein
MGYVHRYLQAFAGRAWFAGSGILLVSALAVVDAGLGAASGQLLPLRGVVDIELLLLAWAAWRLLCGQRRTGRLLAVLGGTVALAALNRWGLAAPLMVVSCAALLVIPAACSAGATTVRWVHVVARGVAAAAVFAGLACLLHALAGPLGAGYPTPWQALALSCLGLVYATREDGLPWSVAAVAAMALSGIGWMGLLGWLIHAAILVQGGTNLVPIAFNSALAFVLLGHALWLLAVGYARSAWCLGLLCVPLAVSPLLAEYFGWADGLGEWLWRQQDIRAEGALPGRLAPNTSFSLLMAVLGLTAAMGARRHAGWWSSAWASGLLVSLAGALSLVGYLFAVPGIRALGPHTPMSLAVAVGLLVLGSGLLASSPRSPWERRYRTVIFPAMMCLLTVISSLFLWFALESQQTRLEREVVQGRHASVVAALREGMDRQVLAIEHMAVRLSSVPVAARGALFDVDAQQYLRDMSGLRALGYANAQRMLQRSYRLSSMPVAAGVALDAAPARKQIFDQTEVDDGPALSAPLTLLDGRAGQVIVAAVRDHGQVQGYIVGVVEFERLFSRLLAAVPVQSSLRISQDGQQLYARGTHARAAVPVSAALALYGQRWRVELYPGPVGAHGRLPPLILLLGFSLGGLLAVSLRLSALARERTRLAEAASMQLREQGSALERALEATRLMMDSAPDVICVLSREACFLQVSAAAQRLWGYAPETLVGSPIARVLHPDDHAATYAAAAAVVQGVPNPNFRNRVVASDGRVLYLQWSAVWSEQSQCMYVIGRDHTELHRAEELEAQQQRILLAIASGRALPEVLTSLVLAYEAQHAGALCSVLLLRDGRLYHGAAPHLPDAYCRCIDGSSIGPQVGSCGTAAWRGERVVVADIASDPLWQQHAALALPHGLRACWSTPVLARDGLVLGTFAVYYRTPRTPSPGEIAGLDGLAALAGVAIEHEQASRQLRESEQRFRSLFDYHPDGVFALTLDGQTVQANPAAAGLLGVERAALPGRAFVRSFALAENVRMQGLLAAARSGESARLDVAALDASGDSFPAHVVGIPIIVEGQARGVFAVLQDQRALRRAQQAMASQLALIAAIAESVGEGLLAVDLHGQPTFLNRMASRALELPGEQLPDRADLPVGMVEPLHAVLAGMAHVADDDACFVLPGQRLLEVAYLATPLVIDGELAGAMLAFRNIASVKVAQRVLQQRNRFFEMSQEMFCIADPTTGHFLQVNPASTRLLGFDESTMLATPFLDLLHPQDKAATTAAIRRQVDGVASIDGLLTRMRCADGSYRWLEWVSISAPDGLLYGAARDVTARREADMALAKAMDDLRIRNRELQDFAYVASHDLQEPLRKIQSFSDRLQSRLTGLDESSRDYLQRMGRAAHRMQALIDDLLAYSRVATRTVAVVPVDLAQVLTVVLDDLETRIAEAQATVTVGPLPTLQADATQMQQLLQNLLANALKFRAAERPCQVNVSAHPLDDGGRWELRVEDNGIGFEPAYAERIFAPFQRLHPRNVYEGTGIGLAIVRRIVERHGGSIRAEACAGQGASFIVTLPSSPSTRYVVAVSDASFTDDSLPGVDS